MPNTYTELRRTVLGTATSSVVFDNIPQGYTDIKLVATPRTSDSSGFFQVFVNNDSSALYSRTYLYGFGGSALSGRATGVSSIQLNCATSSQDVNSFPLLIDFMNYSNTTTNKTTLVRSGSTPVGIVEAWVWLYRSTSAMTSLVITANTTTFTAGSTFSLYGIANADQGAAKATGGIITEDSQYWYHTFGASGAFIPKQSLTCDILQVAGGGGGGGFFHAPGGGAGGLLYTASQSLTAVSHAVTVGAGGNGGSSSSYTAGTAGIASTFIGGAVSLSATGGAGGPATGAGNTGGSGSGGGATSAAGGSGTTGQGNAGGAGYTLDPNSRGGGGGGAGAVGVGGSTTGNGGDGSSAYSSWALVTGTGVSGLYAGGGGGGGQQIAGGAGGAGGGGRGANGSNTNSVVALAGTANTGGGGGGGGSQNNVTTINNGAAGGSGIVIVRYAK